MLRILHLLAVLCLVGAAVVVYKVKYESTYEAQRAGKLRVEIRTEREKINALRADWSRLASPARIQDLATRHLNMKPLSVARIDDLSNLPAKPLGGNSADPIGAVIETLEEKPINDPLGNFMQGLGGGGEKQ